MVMLATRGGVDDIAELQSRGYLFDLKIDGVRCRAEVDAGVVRLLSRAGTDMTRRYPEVVADLAEACPTGHLVLDGEIAVNDDRGLPSWPLTHKRDAQQSAIRRWAEQMPATYYAFDILAQSTVLTMDRWAFANRRQVLEQEVRRWNKPHLQAVLHAADGEALWGVVTELNLEGMVAKRADAPYRSGRSRDWIKIKRTSTVTCLVGGTDPGEGSRASTFGALHLYLLDGDTLVPVGKVGSGFSDRELREITAALSNPPLIVEVEYLDVSPDGQLRQPVFQRARWDARVYDCTLDQLHA